MFQTILDPLEVFAAADSAVSYEYVEKDGRIFKCSSGNRIEGLISTNPADYLNPMYQPGKQIKIDGRQS